MDGLGEYLDKARVILRRVPLIDGHNDWPHLIRGFYDNAIENSSFDMGKSLVGQVDIDRLLKGQVGGVFFSAYVDCPKPEGDFTTETHLPILLETLQQIDLIHRLVDKYSSYLAIASRSGDIRSIFGSGKTAAIIGVEGLHQIGNSPAVLRLYHRLGVRYITLTHNKNNLYADSATAASAVHNGISAIGKAILKEMNRIGMMIDLSHVSESAMQMALETSIAPVIFSHSSAYSVCQNKRNVPDDILRQLKANGGIIMVTLVPEFTHSVAKDASVLHSVDHIMFIGNLIGYDHVGIGSDFDGMARAVQGIESIAEYPNLVAAMLMKGMTDSDVEKVLGMNLIRVLSEVERVAEEASQKSAALEEDIPQLWNDDIRAFAQSVYPHAEGPRKKFEKQA